MNRSSSSREVGSLAQLRVTPKSLVEEVKTKLKQAIFMGLLKPGDRLIEAELCASLGVSRPALREAIRGLEAEKLCETAPHRGAQVPVLSWKDAENLYHVRSLVECEAVALCAANITDKGITQLQAALHRFKKATRGSDPYERVEATTEFYSVILKCSDNAVIEEILMSLLARVNFLRSRSMSIEGRARKSYVEMAAIYGAIKKRDPKAARIAAERHVLNARETARTSFSKSEAPDLRMRQAQL
jgi:DNA-binding GntR family transcriptional regulator